MDPVFNGMGRSEFYRSQIFPELFPHEPPMLMHNWSRDDLEMYCGGKHTPGYDFKDFRPKIMGGVA
jgi:hypothetical protein